MKGNPASQHAERHPHPRTIQSHFYLSPEEWDEFVAVLDAPPQELPEMRILLTKPSVFDAAAEWQEGDRTGSTPE